MRTAVLVVMLVAGFIGGTPRVEAATLEIAFQVEGFRDLEIPIAAFPGEFQLLDSSWGVVLFGGAPVGNYVFSRDDLRHAGSLAPTQYPNPLYTIAIRTAGTPSYLLILNGAGQPLAEGTGIVGGVTVATGALAFLRGATFTTAVVSNTVVVTFTY